MQSQQIERIVQKLQALTPNRIDEAENFIDFISQRDLANAAVTVSEARLSMLWNNPQDAGYDKL